MPCSPRPGLLLLLKAVVAVTLGPGALAAALSEVIEVSRAVIVAGLHAAIAADLRAASWAERRVERLDAATLLVES